MVGLFDVVTYHNFGTVIAHSLPYVGIQFPGNARKGIWGLASHISF